MNNFTAFLLRKYCKYTQWGHDELDIPRKSVLHFGTNSIIDTENIQNMFSEFGINEYPIDVEEFYQALGYDTVVVLEPMESDLDNYELPIEYQGKFDLVVNASASSKIFNQNKIFTTLHVACSVNGHIINILPYFNHNDAHMYNYQPNFIHRLISANEYELLGSWFSLDDPVDMMMYMPSPPLRDEIFEQYPPIKEQKKPVYLGTIFQKHLNNGFKERAADV